MARDLYLSSTNSISFCFTAPLLFSIALFQDNEFRGVKERKVSVAHRKDDPIFFKREIELDTRVRRPKCIRSSTFQGASPDENPIDLKNLTE